jgi:hypothetical protein
MSTFLGLLGVVGFIVLIISLAAGITWAVVKISPTSNGNDSAAKTRAPG